MKKLNKKGVTLIELIVSFALVSVAVGYFYQTLFTVKKLYSKSQKETQEFVDKTYALRIVDACIDKNNDYDSSTIKNTCDSVLTSKYIRKINSISDRNNIYTVTITMENGKNVVLYKYHK